MRKASRGSYQESRGMITGCGEGGKATAGKSDDQEQNLPWRRALHRPQNSWPRYQRIAKGFKALVRLLGVYGQLLLPVQSHATIVLKIDKGVEDIDASRIQCCRKDQQIRSKYFEEISGVEKCPCSRKGCEFCSLFHCTATVARSGESETVEIIDWA